ncbi:FxSxx-COOH system tetratricopeptide repeat protein [Actinoplanes sp. NPDC051851]|uniref:FxSxx-COOH system tetratricopeptide repeat protein n=1 Tax=Actinoplanes sp. NPDC051851 TaxID=3154753 RepID=UPI00344376B3
MSDEGRWWFFRLAGNAGGEFLRKHHRYAPQAAVTLRRPLSWPRSAGDVGDLSEARIDDASRAALAELLMNFPVDALRRAAADMIGPRGGVQLAGADLPAVLRAVERAVEPVTGVMPILGFAERLAHASTGALQRRLHGWVLIAGRPIYPDDRLRELCWLIGKTFADSFVSLTEEAASDLQDRGGVDPISSDNRLPGGSAVLAPSSVSSPSTASPVETPRPIRGGLPPKNPDFTGREGLLSMLSEMLAASSTVSVVPQALHGLGGVGKTQLAAEFAYRHADEYWLVWWMTAESATQVRQSFAQLALRLGIPVGQDMKQTSALVLETLSASPFNWLLVYDNVESPETLADLVPSTGVGHVIVTSRNNAAWSARGNAIEVDVFERSESIQLIRRHGRAIDDDSADRLADKLGDLPLALEQAANWHATTGMPIAEYLELLDANLEELLSEGKPIDYPQTIYVVLKLAVHRLRAEMPAAAELLELFAYLGPVPISVTTLRAGRGGGLSGNLQQALDRPIDLNRAIREVRRFGLAKVDEGQRVQVHRLTQRVLRTELLQERLRQSRENAQRLLTYANPGYPDDPDNWPMLSEVAPHIDAAELIDAEEHTARLVVVDQIRYFFVIGDYEASRALGEVVVDRWTNGGPGPDDELTLIAQRHLANAYRLLGETGKARRLGTDTFERLRRDPRFGEDHEHTLYTANLLGVDLRLEGQFAEALMVEEDNVARHLRVLGSDEQATWRAQNNLAVSLRHLGRFAEASAVDEEILRRWRKQVGEGDSRTLLCMVNLAQDYYGEGRYQQALSLMRTAVPQLRDMLGPRHRDPLMAGRTLTMALRKSGFYAEARDNGRQSYRDHYTRFGSQHEQTLAATIGYANALRCCGRPSEITEARTLLREAVDHYREAFSAMHPLALAAKVNLALVLRSAGDFADARQVDENALAGLTVALGERHPYTLAASSGLVEDLVHAGATEEAERLAWSTYQLSIEARGAAHPDTLACAINAALLRMDRDDSAQALFDETLTMMSRVLGADHPATLDAVRGQRADCDIEPPRV